MKRKLIKGLGISTVVIATMMATTGCIWIFHQPKQPNTLA